MEKTVRLLNLGLMQYGTALKIQQHCSRRLLDKISGKRPSENITNVVLLVEHPPVYTVGMRRKDYTEQDREKLTRLGAEFHATNRGGLITFHGPGQLIAYPIIHLKDFKLGMRDYVCLLEKTVIEMCYRYGIQASTSPDTGVWVGSNKLAAIGVHGSRYVTSHGVGINCNTDLTWFEHIIPCGIVGKGVTSLSRELDCHVTIKDAIQIFIESFEVIFKCSIEEIHELNVIIPDLSL